MAEIKVFVMTRLIRLLHNPRDIGLQHEPVEVFAFLSAEIIVNWVKCICLQVRNKSLLKASKFKKRDLNFKKHLL